MVKLSTQDWARITVGSILVTGSILAILYWLYLMGW
jgi:hypothetical protein